jgi:hypothetical protein
MRCCKCDWKLPDDANFCSKCRAPQTSEPARGWTKPCVACGEPLRLSARFCSKCPTPQPAADAVPPSVSEGVPELESDRCSSCGYFLAAGDAACGNCSEPRNGPAFDAPASARPEAARPKPVNAVGRDAELPPDIARFRYLWSPAWTAICPNCRVEWGPEDIPCQVCKTFNLWSYNNRFEYEDDASWHLELRCARCRNMALAVSCPAPHKIPILGLHLVTEWRYPNPLFYFPYMVVVYVSFLFGCIVPFFVLPLILAAPLSLAFFWLCLTRLLHWARTLGFTKLPLLRPIGARLCNPQERPDHRRKLEERPFA